MYDVCRVRIVYLLQQKRFFFAFNSNHSTQEANLCFRKVCTLLRSFSRGLYFDCVEPYAAQWCGSMKYQAHNFRCRSICHGYSFLERFPLFNPSRYPSIEKGHGIKNAITDLCVEQALW